MAGLEVPVHPLVDVLTAQFASLIEAGNVDIVHDLEHDAVEIQSDEWTLILEGWPIHNAFVALDTLTDSDALHRVALNGALGIRDFAALTHANQQLEGSIARALVSSGDGVSRILAELIDSGR